MDAGKGGNILKAQRSGVNLPLFDCYPRLFSMVRYRIEDER